MLKIYVPKTCQLKVETDGEYVITLKEITDLIDVRHNNAMRKVEELAKEEGFGLLQKTCSKQKTGFGERDMETYIFTKKQAIAVGARLNNTMLMKVINRLEELEAKKAKPTHTLPQSYSEALRQLADTVEQKDKLQLQVKEQQPKVEFYDTLTQSSHTGDMATVAKLLHKDIGRNRLFTLLRNRGVLMRSNQPYQKYCDLGYFKVVERNYISTNGKTAISMKTVVFQKGIDFINRLLKESALKGY